VCCGVLQCIAVNTLQFVVVRCGVLQCVAARQHSDVFRYGSE